MSPTEAMLIRRALLALAGGSVGAGGSGVAGAVSLAGAGRTSGGADAQPASDARASKATLCENLITEPDAQHVDLRSVQTAAQYIEVFEITGWAYANTMICLVVN